MTFEVTILGCGAATPTLQLNPAAQVVNLHDKLFLVDCGEGTQVQMRRTGVKFQRISHVFISHLHGDHYLGLMGYISSMHLLGRKTKLHIYGAPELNDLIQMHLRVSETFLAYEIEFHPLNVDGTHVIFEDATLTITSVPLKHRIPCCGFLFAEKQRPFKIIPEKVREYGLTAAQVIRLKKGESVESTSGQTITSSDVCMRPPAPRKYAYISDTAYWEKLKETLSGVDLLYHESTFLESEKVRAKKTFHSTASQAAKMASLVGAGQLLLGHFSSRYRDLQAFFDQASVHFSNTLLAEEGSTYQIKSRS